MAKILSGKEVSAVKREAMAREVESLKAAGKRLPCLAVIQVGSDPASSIYVRNKVRSCEAIGILSRLYTLDESIGEDRLISQIESLNEDPTVDGILCQLPLPAGMDEDRILDAVMPSKDVDGFHPLNVGSLHMGRSCPLPCTAAGIIEILRYYDIPLSGANALVVGRSQIVGKPVAALLLQENATVTIAHSRTKDLKELARQADIVVAAIGRHHYFDASYFKPEAVVIDVGIHHVDGKVQGDVDQAAVEAHVAALTPVPGGVGPMTITMLLENTLTAYGVQEANRG